MRYLIILLLFTSFAQGQMMDKFMKFGGSCTVTSGNIFPEIAGGECSTDDTTGWSGVNATVASVLVGSDYVMEITQLGSTQTRGEYSITVDNSSTYDITYDVRVTVTNVNEQQVSAWTGVATSPQRTFNDDGSWYTHTETVTTNSTTMLMRFYARRGTSAAGKDVIQLRNLSVIKQ